MEDCQYRLTWYSSKMKLATIRSRSTCFGNTIRPCEQHVHRNMQNLKVSQEASAAIYEFDSIAADGTKEVRR